MLSIVKVQAEGPGVEAALVLFKEYFDELNENLCFQKFDEELKNPLKKYGEPYGALFVAYHNEDAAGCIALQPIKPPTREEFLVCEMKRLYVRPSYRRQKIGDELVKVLLNEAAAKGYKKMVLDTLDRLQAAIALYHRYGFLNTSAYYANPLPGVVYMEKLLV